MGRGRQSEGSTAETVRKRPERPWTAARTMEVLRRCPLAIAQRLVHCAIALSTAVLDRVTKTMSVAPLLMNNLDNSKQKRSNLLSPAPPPFQLHLPPLRSLDLMISPGTLCGDSFVLFLLNVLRCQKHIRDIKMEGHLYFQKYGIGGPEFGTKEEFVTEKGRQLFHTRACTGRLVVCSSAN